MVVLDCANIAYAYGNNHFNAKGIDVAIKFFLALNIQVVAFLQASYVQKKHCSKMTTEDVDLLNSLVSSRKITLVPSGDHDDVFILSHARNCNAFVVSNDFFNDHLRSIIDESTRLSMKLWIEENRCSFTFLDNTTFMINPGNVLATLCGYLGFQEKKRDFNECVDTVVESLTSTIEVLLKCERYEELKYVLLARATTYIDVSLSYLYKMSVLYMYDF